jgi:Transposase DDE domain group 1
VKATGWLRGLEVTTGGTGIVSHAGVALLRVLADNTGLTGGLSRALASDRLLVHDRGRVLADLACAIADGAEVISDFRVMGDQHEVFGLVASVPTCWRALNEIAGGGRALARVTAAVNAARRRAWAGIEARHGALPAVAVADKMLKGVTCIRLDASVVPAHSDKELAEPNFKGFGHHPLLAYCDNTAEPLAGMLRKGSAGSNTVAGHLDVVGAAITALPPKYRRRLMVTCDGAGASHGLIERLDKLAARPGHQLAYSVGWELGERERSAIRQVPEAAWQIALDHRGEIRERRADQACADRGCAHRRCWIEEAHVTELTGLLREGPGGDQLAGWPATMRVFARRERPHPGAQLTLFEAEDGWRYSLWVTNLPATVRGWRANPAYIDAAHRVHARVEDCVRTGKDTGIGKLPSHLFALNQAWLAAALIAATLLAWLRLLALDGPLCQSRAQDLALPHPARRRPADPQRTPAPPQNRCHLALGTSDRDRLGPDRRAAASTLTSANPSLRPRKKQPAGPVEPPATRPASRAAVIPAP